jgi:hypothetical protein
MARGRRGQTKRFPLRLGFMGDFDTRIHGCQPAKTRAAPPVLHVFYISRTQRLRAGRVEHPWKLGETGDRNWGQTGSFPYSETSNRYEPN